MGKKLNKKELFKECFCGGDWWFYLLFPITFIYALGFFLIFWAGGVEIVDEEEL